MTEELVAASVETAIRAGALKPGQIMASFDITTDEGQIMAFNASSSADEKLDDHIEEVLTVVDYFIEAIEVLNEATGEVEVRPHVIVFDADGVAYEAQSKTLPDDLKKLFQFRSVSPENPATVKFVKKKAKLGSMFKIKLVKE